MSLVWIAVLALAAPGDEGATSPGYSTGSNYSSSSSAPPSTSPALEPTAKARSGKVLVEAIRAALKKWEKPKPEELAPAAHEFIGLYLELRQDQVMARSQREDLHVRLRCRLAEIAKEISQQWAAKEKVANAPKSVAIEEKAKTLHQIGAAGGAGAGYGGTAGGNANANADDGPLLVDLIQTVISPKSWDVNGGNGTIFYWPNQHAIVVHNTAEVQEQISDAIEQLNRSSH